MKKSGQLFSASLGLYLLVFPVMFFGLHSHPPKSDKKSELVSILNQDSCLDQDDSTCSLCDQFFDSVGFIEYKEVLLNEALLERLLNKLTLAESYKIIFGIGLRGPPTYFL